MVDSLYSLIRRLELQVKKRISGPLRGDAHSAFRGIGFEFNQLRDYEQGDDIRFIDWKASARTSTVLVRRYLEDRNRTIYIALDVSGSTLYGSAKTKYELMSEVAAVLLFVALHAKDSVGLVLFSDRIEKIVPARASRAHVVSLVKLVLSYEPRATTTRLHLPLEYCMKLKGQRAVVCMVSDFLGVLDQRLVKLVASKHDFRAFRCLDPLENHFLPLDALLVEDSETGDQRLLGGALMDLSLQSWHRKQLAAIRSGGGSLLDIEVGTSYASNLLAFLRCHY